MKLPGDIATALPPPPPAPLSYISASINQVRKSLYYYQRNKNKFLATISRMCDAATKIVYSTVHMPIASASGTILTD